MKKTLLLSLLIPLISYSASVELVSNSAPQAFAQAIGDNLFTVEIDASSTGALTFDTATTVYLPFQGAGGRSFHRAYAGIASLPTGAAGDKLVIRVNADVDDSTTAYLHIAYVASSSATNGSVLRASTAKVELTADNSSLDFYIDINDICQNDMDCTGNLTAGNDSSEAPAGRYFVFLNDAELGDTDPVTLSTHTDKGFYLDIKGSNDVNADIIPAITSTGKGDREAYLSYTFSSALGNAKEVAVYRLGAGIGAGSSVSAAGVIEELHKEDENAFSTSGEVRAKNLVNGTTYEISIAGINKYGFVTALTESKAITPTEISALLASQSCFLLTAGFGEKHYVVDYFRNFRDHFLRANELGQSFISFYYEIGPKLAHYVYNSRVLSLVVKGLAYSAYFVMNDPVALGVVLLLILGPLFVIRKFI